MEVERADPAPVVAEDPAYRVVFWASTGAAEEYRVTHAASVHEALSWAELKSQGRRFGLYAETGAADEPQLLRLSGRAPSGGAT